MYTGILVHVSGSVVSAFIITDIAISINQSINHSFRKTSNVKTLTHLGHEHQAPDHEVTQPMMGY
jgi:hypothetical protein